MFDTDNNLWGCVHGKGLYRYVIDKNGMKSVEVFENDTKDPTSISAKRLTVVYQDSAGIIWIGTRAGLNRLVQTDPVNDEKGKITFISYRRGDGLLDEVIHGILEDDSNNLWVI